MKKTKPKAIKAWANYTRNGGLRYADSSPHFQTINRLEVYRTEQSAKDNAAPPFDETIPVIIKPYEIVRTPPR